MADYALYARDAGATNIGGCSWHNPRPSFRNGQRSEFATTAAIRYQAYVRSTGSSVAGFAGERYLVGRAASSKGARSSSASKVNGGRKVADGYDGTKE